MYAQTKSRTDFGPMQGSNFDLNFKGRIAYVQGRAKPIETSAQETGFHARASTAYVCGPSGVLVPVAVNQPRYAYAPTSRRARGLTIEQASKNWFLHSRTFTEGAWGKSGMAAGLAGNVGIAPPAQSSIFSDTSASVGTMGQTVTIPNTVLPWTFAIYLRRRMATKLWSLALHMRDGGGSILEYGSVDFDLAAGIVALKSSNVSTRMTDAGGGFLRCEVTLYNAVGAVSLAAYLYRTVSGDGQSQVEMDGATLEPLSAATSLIVSAGTQGERAVESATFPLSAIGWNLNEGTVYCEAEFDGPPNLPGYLWSIFKDDDASQYLYAKRIVSGPAIAAQAWNGSDGPFLPTYGAPSPSVQRVAYSFKAGAHILVKSGGGGEHYDGGAAAPATSASMVMPTNLTKMQIGHFYPTEQINGCVGRWAYFPFAMPVEQLSQLVRS